MSNEGHTSEAIAAARERNRVSDERATAALTEMERLRQEQAARVEADDERRSADDGRREADDVRRAADDDRRAADDVRRGPGDKEGA